MFKKFVPILTELYNWMILSLLVSVTSLPVITIGNSIYALSQTLIQLKKDTVSIPKTYLHYFKEDFICHFVIGICIELLMFACFLQTILYIQSASSLLKSYGIFLWFFAIELFVFLQLHGILPSSSSMKEIVLTTVTYLVHHMLQSFLVWLLMTIVITSMLWNVYIFLWGIILLVIVGAAYIQNVIIKLFLHKEIYK